MTYELSTAEVINSKEHQNVVKSVKKHIKNWEVDMFVDCEYDWQGQASKLLEERSARLILDNLTNDELLELSMGDYDMNALIRTLKTEN